MINFFTRVQPLFWSNHFFLIIFLIFVLLRLIPILFVEVVPASDSGWYYQRAIEISQGLGYKRREEFTAFWPIGYPAFLAGIFKLSYPSVLIGQLANLFLASLSLLIIIKITYQITNNESLTKLTALLFTFYPNSIAYSSLLLSEILFTTLLLLACWLYIRKETIFYGVLSGIIFGFATLVKSQAILIPIVLVLFSFFIVRESKFKVATLLKAFALFIAFSIVLTPWIIRNYNVFGEFVFVSTNGGISMLAGNNPGMSPDFRKDYDDNDEYVKSVGHPIKPELQVDKEAKKKAIQWIANNPEKFIGLIPHKIWRLWAPDGEAEWAYQATNTKYSDNELIFRFVRVLNQVYYVSIIVLTILFPILYLRKHPPTYNQWIWLSYLLAIITTLVSILFSGQSRYHYPIIPFLMINASWVILHLRQHFLHLSKQKVSI